MTMKLPRMLQANTPVSRLRNVWSPSARTTVVVCAVLASLVVGVSSLRSSDAATFVATQEAESGTVAGRAVKLTGQAGASDTGAVKFGAGTVTPPPSGNGNFHAFGSVVLTADFNVAGAGSNVDSIGFWEAPDPVNSLMFVTSKNVPLVEVWKYPFKSPADQLPALKHSCINAGTNGVTVDQETDKLYINVRNSPNNCVFSLPSLSHQLTFTSGVSYGVEPNSTLLRLPNGEKRLFVSDDTKVFIHDAVSGRNLGQFATTRGLETMWGDNLDQILYIPDENGRSGVYAYKPDGTAYTRNGASKFGDNTIFNSDAEGILQYTCPADGRTDTGQGLIVVSDQITSVATGNDYEVFDRRSWAYLGKVKLKLPTGAFVYDTDGIASTQQSSAMYPGGVFAGHNANVSVAGVGWNKVFAAISAQTGKAFGCAN